MYRKNIFLVIILCTVLTACSEQKIVNKIILIHAISFDTVSNGIKSAGLIAHFNEKGKTEIHVLHTESNSSKGTLSRLNKATKAPLKGDSLKR